jgi:hypothetical protein
MRCMRRAIVLLIAVAAVVSLTGIASARPTAKQSVSPGVVFGGRTAQAWPVAIEVSHDGHQVVRADIALSVKCGIAATSVFHDSYAHIVLSAAGNFSSSFGPQTFDFAPGQKGDLTGRIKGKLNARRTSGTGTWSLNVVVHDATTGAVVDNCQSGNVTWKVKQ